MAEPHRLEVDGRAVTISSPDKVLFPRDGITKLDLVRHHVAVAPLLLAQVGGHALTLRRFPDGIDAEGWFQKHAPKGLPPWVGRAEVPRSGGDGRTVTHVVADHAATLAVLGNLAAIELHVSMAPVERIDRPREIVWDLDPPKDADARIVRRATRRTRALLEELGMRPRLKTSGSRGFHVHVALDGEVEQAASRDLAQLVAVLLERRHPGELTAEHRIAKRGGRVFVDWLRNSPGQTAIAPYGVRARDGAPVATPMTWDELPGTDPARWTLRSIQRRLGQRACPWSSPPERVGRARILEVVDTVRAEVA